MRWSRRPFGRPRDNGKQFEAAEFREYCLSIGVKKCNASVDHPKANRLVEKMNGTLFHGVGRALTGLPKGKWAEVLPSVLWSIRTTAARPTGFTPFKLLYGSEAVTPEEVKSGSLRTSCPVNPAEVADAEESLSKELLKETRLQAVNNLQKYMASVEKSYNQKVRPREFAPGDLSRQAAKQMARPVHYQSLGAPWCLSSNGA